MSRRNEMHKNGSSGLPVLLSVLFDFGNLYISKTMQGNKKQFETLTSGNDRKSKVAIMQTL